MVFRALGQMVFFNYATGSPYSNEDYLVQAMVIISWLKIQGPFLLAFGSPGGYRVPIPPKEATLGGLDSQ